MLMTEAPIPHLSPLTENVSPSDSACQTQQEPIEWDDLVHDLRQPLSTIESLAYYLELVCADPNTRNHLQQIQELVTQANSILEHASVEAAC